MIVPPSLLEYDPRLKRKTGEPLDPGKQAASIINCNRSGGGEQDRGRATRLSRRDRLGQQGKHVSPLLTACRDDGKQALDDAIPVRALGAKTDLAPDHGGPQRPLGGIVGGFHPITAGKRPERLPPGAQRMTQIVHFRPGAGLPIRDRRLEGLLDRYQRCLEARTVGRPIAEGVPGVEHRLHLHQHRICPGTIGHVRLRQPADRPLEMGPAELTLCGGIAVVGGIAVRDHDARVVRGQQIIQTHPSATGGDAKTGRLRADPDPQPAALPGLLPARFVHMHDRCRLEVGVDGGIQRLHGTTDPLGAGDGAAQAHAHPRKIVQELGHLTIGQVTGAVHVADERGEAWAIAGGGRVRQGGRNSPRTARAGQGVQLVFGHVDAAGGHLPDLMGVHRDGIGRDGWQGALAVRAGGGCQRDDLIGGTWVPLGAGMIGLGTARTPPRRPGWAGRGAGRIGRRRFGRILGGLLELGRQHLHLCGQGLHLHCHGLDLPVQVRELRLEGQHEVLDGHRGGSPIRRIDHRWWHRCRHRCSIRGVRGTCQVMRSPPERLQIMIVLLWVGTS